MFEILPASLRNRQMLPLVTQPWTAGKDLPSRSLKSWIATISATHWPRAAHDI